MTKKTIIIIDDKLYEKVLKSFDIPSLKMSEASRELLEINIQEDGRMGSWCGCGWWSRYKFGIRQIIEVPKGLSDIICISKTVCNKCNKLNGPSGYCFPQEKSQLEKLGDRVSLLEKELKK